MSNAWPKSKFNIVMLSSASTRRNNKNEAYDNTLTKVYFNVINFVFNPLAQISYTEQF